MKSRLDNQPRLLWALLFVMVAASFAVRIAAWAYWGTGTIESEGAEYAKIAENLRSGVGFAGFVSPGPQVLFNPLFPVLIAGASFLTHNYEDAGRLVTLVLCAVLPLPVFGIASRLFNRRVGLIAAALIVLHPLLVQLSFMVYSEGPYATLLLSAVYLVIRTLHKPSTRMWFWIGGAFGLCYLFRAEAFAAFAISLLFALFATEGTRTVRFKRAGYAVVVFLALALPEVLFIHKSTGKVMLEGKSTILFSYTGRRFLAAERKPEENYVSDGGQIEVPSPAPNSEGGYPDRWEDKFAAYGIDSNLKGMGFAMRPFAETARETHVRITQLLPLIAKGIRRNIPGLFQKLSSGWLGAPLLPALALLGAFRRPWRGAQALDRLFVTAISAAPVVATMFVLWGDARYYFIFVPILCIWAANGLYEIGLWFKTSTTSAGWKILARPAISQWIVPGLLGLCMIVIPVAQVRALYEFSDSAPASRVNKELGLWIGHRQNRPTRIMDLSLPLSYHAGADQHLYFPYSTGDLALRYLDSAQIDYIVLRRGGIFTKYYEDWLTHGIPDPRAQLLQLPDVAGADKFVIYEWHRDGSAK